MGVVSLPDGLFFFDSGRWGPKRRTGVIAVSALGYQNPLSTISHREVGGSLRECLHSLSGL